MIFRLIIGVLLSGWLHYMMMSHSLKIRSAEIVHQTFPSSLEVQINSVAVEKVEAIQEKEKTIPLSELEEPLLPVEEEKVLPVVKEQESSIGSIQQGVVQAEVLQGQIPPTYPLLARARKIEGRVLVRIEVLENGVCGSVQVKESSGYTLLDNAALEGVQKWRFQPAQENGKKVKSQIEIPVIFQLD